jgi:hypothetical protein
LTYARRKLDALKAAVQTPLSSRARDGDDDGDKLGESLFILNV